jgi:hypothetical protein
MQVVSEDWRSLSFFSPCEACAESTGHRSLVIRLNACPVTCDWAKRIQARLMDGYAEETCEASGQAGAQTRAA